MDALRSLFQEYWPHLLLGFSIIASALAATHAAMSKQDVRAAIAWVGVILMSPLFGSAAYLIAGINRVRRSQVSQQRDRTLRECFNDNAPDVPAGDVVADSAPQFASLRTLSDQVNRFPLRSGNSIQLLSSGDEAYPAMLQAIESASRSIALQSYIFDHDRIGCQIADALGRAQARGVQVRVLIDAVGVKYSRPRITRLLRRHGVYTALFMTNPFGLRMPYANLRSHRKILVVDGRIGFTGGMNIREGFTTAAAGTDVAIDTHFRVEGPIVLQLMSVFAHDWEFTTQETLPYATWGASAWQPPAPHAIARCVRSGPDRFLGSSHDMLLGALAVAQQSVRIQSPYFLPDQVLIGALKTAARRGVQVDIVIPGRNNLRLVNYAMTSQLDQIIRHGCRVWRASGNFNHSKLLTVDGAWSYVGSSNLDPRSLRLNFELDIEIYNRDLAADIARRIDADIDGAEPVTLASLAAIPFRKRLRNRLFWLASPYL